jgi:putative membrane protein insertion efficiency factor
MNAPASTAGLATATTDAGRRARRRPGRLIRAVLLPVRFYQRVISPALPRRCKYHPTCSDYAVQAISSYGILRGGTLAGWRLLRCNPWSHGGYDPVSAQTLFRRPPRSPQPPPSDS